MIKRLLRAFYDDGINLPQPSCRPIMEKLPAEQAEAGSRLFAKGICVELKHLQPQLPHFHRLAKTLYLQSPVCLRFLIQPFTKIVWLLHVLKPEQWLITGKELYSKKRLTLLYAGDSKNRYFLARQAFGDLFKEEYIGKKWLWAMIRTAQNHRHASRLVIIEFPRILRWFLHQRRFFYLPSWVHGEVDLSLDTQALFSHKEYVRAVRIIRKNRLTHSESCDADDLCTFYHSMYLPYISSVHGEGAFIERWEVIKSKFKHGLLLFIHKGEQRIVATLIELNKHKPHFLFAGVKDGDSSIVDDGGVEALYYMGYDVLRGKGYLRANLGPSRGFLKDGLLFYKKKRGLSLFGFSNMGFLIQARAKTESMKSFLINNPFIYAVKKNLFGAVFLDVGQSLSEVQAYRLYGKYGIRGLSKLCFYRFTESDGTLQELVPDHDWTNENLS